MKGTRTAPLALALSWLSLTAVSRAADGAFQLYAAAHDSIVAENRGARMDGFTVRGLNPHGWGYQPSWGCQFLDNEILEGNGYGNRQARFGAIAEDTLVESCTVRDTDTGIAVHPNAGGTLLRRNRFENVGRPLEGQGLPPIQ